MANRDGIEITSFTRFGPFKRLSEISPSLERHRFVPEPTILAQQAPPVRDVDAPLGLAERLGCQGVCAAAGIQSSRL